LCDAAERIVGEICGVAVCVGDAEQIIFCVVAVGCYVAGRVGNGGQTVSIVIRVAGGFAVLVCGRCATAERIVSEGRCRAASSGLRGRIGDGDEPVDSEPLLFTATKSTRSKEPMPSSNQLRIYPSRDRTSPPSAEHPPALLNSVSLRKNSPCGLTCSPPEEKLPKEFSRENALSRHSVPIAFLIRLSRGQVGLQCHISFAFDTKNTSIDLPG
jgi:hypothetical protein